MDKGRLERELSTLSTFSEPRVDLEQYPTPAWLAAHLVHLADTQGDVAGRTVLDLGTGTGLLALAASTRQPERVFAVERDPRALETARENETVFDSPNEVHWLLGDATRLPLVVRQPVTVLMNPPFGAQRSNAHADRRFLESVASLSVDAPTVSYSIHNAGSRSFVESYASDRDATVTHAFEATFALDRQFDFQTADSADIAVEVYRIDWS